ncbi:alpha/beta hydrolase family protein [Saccharopolyspora gloriosae]|uniref:alpha/beta hydrolase n=1 Tax=Saccharopolyspora gloriosae TaxID=455344 RepID=UPI001FB70C12|nr:alpha/beta hydrolase family protein [Saccharopolyspora gloriosae]
MKALLRAVPRGWVAALVGITAMSGLSASTAVAAEQPPHFDDGNGITVVAQPQWVDEEQRTFKLTVRSDQVPEHPAMQEQVSGEHVILVTLPAEYDGTTRYPVNYSLHGAPDRPDSLLNKLINERATEDVPLITVTPNGGGRGWYSNWVSPGSSGEQNWETFHLDQVIPLIDANLKTIPSRAGRAITGHSMGGFGAFHYAQHRPELFSYVGSFSGDLDLLNPEMRAAITASTKWPAAGTPLDPPDAIFGSPVWPLDGIWNAQSPAQHVESLRGMGVAIYAGNGGNLLDNTVQAVAEHRVRETAVVASANLKAAGIPHEFVDYGDGTGWGEGCNGKHAQYPCLQADMNHYVDLIMERLQHP